MQPDRIYNDFVLKFANVNGSGSASANLLCAKTLFRMGIPVAAKNIFPSNIQGLPTWYEIRASEAGHLARREGIDIMVAMNPQSYVQDVQDVAPGGALIYDSSRERDFGRNDIQVIGIPIARMCADEWANPRQRQLFKNMVYLGALIHLIDLDGDVIEAALADQFKGKEKLVGPNVKALHMGRDFMVEHGIEKLRFGARPTDKTDGKIMIQGNEAAGIGCLFAGATVASWYPITPSTSLVEGFEKHAETYRYDDKGRMNAAVVQAEDELSAIGMAVGAAWNGARAFTATSGPGISLMAEFIGLAYFAEIPLVLFDIQRGGPSTGMPTRTQQSDLLACAYASHGDTCHIMLLPGDPKECFEMAADAFDVAERLQTAVFVMSDLDIGMNDWVVDELTWDKNRSFDRGKVMDAEMLETMDFARYRDVDGDGIPYRTYPGTHPEKGSYFTRGTSHTDTGAYTEDGEIHAETLTRIKRKINEAANSLPAPIVTNAGPETKLGIINFGSTTLAVEEGQSQLAADNLAFDHLRIRAFPFADEVKAFCDAHDHIFVIEQNRDAQMRHLLIIEAEIAAEKLIAINSWDGTPLTANFVQDEILKKLARIPGYDAVIDEKIPAE